MRKEDKIAELEYVIGQWYEANEVCGFDTYTEKQSKELKSFWLKMCKTAKGGK